MHCCAAMGFSCKMHEISKITNIMQIKKTSLKRNPLIINKTGQRLRLDISEIPNSGDGFKGWLSQQNIVQKYRINALANCCVVVLTADTSLSSHEIDTWINEYINYDTNPKITRIPLKVCRNELNDLDKVDSAKVNDEPFVPNRLVLPTLSLLLVLLAGPLSIPPLAVGCFIIISSHLSFKRAWAGLTKEKQVNVDFLDSLAITLQANQGFFLGPALMITMIEGGEAVRDASKRFAHAGHNELLAGLQTEARVLINDAEVIIDSDKISTGDKVLFFPGDYICVDGIILSGEAVLDVVKLTGESFPRNGLPGDEVLAGFILLEGKIIVETNAVGECTRIGQIAAMIASAPVYDTRVGNIAEKIANNFVIPTLILAGISLLVSSGNMVQAASLLMFDFGTGLRVSIPTVIMAALSRASNFGLLIRSGRSLELLNKVDVVIFDKTGTLTLGKPSVVNLEIVNDTFDVNTIVRFAITVETGLNHPVAKAIVDYGISLGIETGNCDSWEYVIGKGVDATIEGHNILVGNSSMLSSKGISLMTSEINPNHQALSPIYLVIDNILIAIFYISDEVRPDSAMLIAELHRRGIKTHMITGDVADVAYSVAAKLGINARNVYSEALPDQKAKIVKEISELGYKVLFVGDGINDSAAMAYADISVSFASGSDLARETADIVLTNDKVSDLLVAHELATSAFKLINQNIGIIGAPNLSALLIGTFFPINPVSAVILNNGSTLLAAANALRCLRFKPNMKLFKTQQLPYEASTSVNISTGSLHTKLIKDFKNENNSFLSTNLASNLNNRQIRRTKLTCADLSRRLKVTHQAVTYHRHHGDFESWSKHHDPENMAWCFDSITKTYQTGD